MGTRPFAPDALIFDVDGVLLNVEKSFPEVIRLSVLEGWAKFCGGTADSPGYTKEHERILKRHAAFNDDYDIVWVLLSIAAAGGVKELSGAFPSPARLATELESFSGTARAWAQLRYANGPDYNETRKMCANRYLSELYKLEKPMLRCHWRQLPLPAAIYTGRNQEEWRLAKKNLAWEDFPDDLVIHSDSGIKKPSPLGLAILCERLGAERPAFFGDTGSDFIASRNFGKGYFVAVGNLLPEAEYVYGDPEKALADLLNFKVRGEKTE